MAAVPVAGVGPPAGPAAGAATAAARSDIGGFVLEQVGGRRRLCLARGADRLEIGAGLREPDREWLLAVLRRWHAADQPTGAAGSLFESQRSTAGPGG